MLPTTHLVAESVERNCSGEVVLSKSGVLQLKQQLLELSGKPALVDAVKELVVLAGRFKKSGWPLVSEAIVQVLIGIRHALQHVSGRSLGADNRARCLEFLGRSFEGSSRAEDVCSSRSNPQEDLSAQIPLYLGSRRSG